MKKIVIAIDSFKGCLSSADAAHAVADACRERWPEAEILAVPLADGGEGTVDAVAAMGWSIVETLAKGPLGLYVDARYCIKGKTCVIESASACGLCLVPSDMRNPMLTTSYGLGELVADARRHGCTEFYIGLGGSATNDAATGALKALGYRFLDINGKEIEEEGGRILSEIAGIDSSARMTWLDEVSITLLCDVDAPFFGSRGAARVFAPQKGATPCQVEALDKGLESFDSVLGTQCDFPGAGAAGGIAGALHACLGAEICSGVDTLLSLQNFDEMVADASLVITGEGRLDGQTLMGKAPAGVLKAAQKYGVPVVALGGSVADEAPLLEAGFAQVLAVSDPSLPLCEAMKPDITKTALKRAISKVL